METQGKLGNMSLSASGHLFMLHDSAYCEKINYQSHHNFVGNYGEYWLANQFSQAGYFAQKTSPKTCEGDLRVLDTQTGEWLKIEAKTALETTSCYGFCMFKTKKTDCSYSDFVALICIDQQLTHYLYLIHPSLFTGSQFIRISSHPTRYSGKYAKFRVRGLININDVRDTHEVWGLK